MTTQQPTLCIGILTINEARRIEGCIQSAHFADQIVVVDSGSKDDTVAIAQRLGAQVHAHADWQGFAEQRNRLLQYVTCDYIFFLDADEIITPELQVELQAMVSSAYQGIGNIVWLEVAFGRPLRYLRTRKPIARLFRTSNLKCFEGAVHENPQLVDDSVIHLTCKNPLLHFSRETVHDSLKKLTQYAMLGAAKRASKKRAGGLIKGLIMAIWTFVRIYIVKLAFLEMGAGFLYSLFIALEVFFRYAALSYDRERLSNAVGR